MKAWTITEIFSVPKIQDAYGENCNAANKAGSDKRAAIFKNELVRCINMRQTA
jgi:hypothetical protein